MFEEQEFKKILLLMKTCMVVSITAACIVACVVICTHWRGFSFRISPVAAPDTKVVVIERAAPARQRKPRPSAVPQEDVPQEDIPQESAPHVDVPETSYQSGLPRVNEATARIETAAPEALTPANIHSGGYAARVPAYGEVSAFTVPDFSVTVRPKKHRWPRRLFGAIGHGFGKVFGFR
jgi:hypothetical protein